jgi:hypothetical protein
LERDQHQPTTQRWLRCTVEKQRHIAIADLITVGLGRWKSDPLGRVFLKPVTLLAVLEELRPRYFIGVAEPCIWAPRRRCEGFAARVVTSSTSRWPRLVEK